MAAAGRRAVRAARLASCRSGPPAISARRIARRCSALGQGRAGRREAVPAQGPRVVGHGAAAGGRHALLDLEQRRTPGQVPTDAVERGAQLGDSAPQPDRRLPSGGDERRSHRRSPRRESRGRRSSPSSQTRSCCHSPVRRPRWRGRRHFVRDLRWSRRRSPGRAAPARRLRGAATRPGPPPASGRR